MTIANRGTTVLVVSNVQISDGRFSADPASFTVAPGSSQSVTVNYSPTSAGTRYATLTINSNDLEYPTISMVINGTGTGDGVLASLPDTTARYQQVLALPVRVSDTTGEGVVSAEVSVAYDGDLLVPGSPAVTTGAMTAGWTLESNVVQGSGTVIDTLKLALADETALTGSGELVLLHFTVVNRRTPATSALTLTQVLFNDGSPKGQRRTTAR